MTHETPERAEVLLQRLQLALAAGHLGDWTWDTRTDGVSLSARAAEIFGLAADKPLTWREMRALLHPDDAERARLAVEQSIATRSHYDIEYRVRLPGAVRWIAARGYPTYGPDGAVTGMVGVVQDISGRKQADERWQEEARILETLNRTGALLASQLDLQALLQAVTDAATELSGAQFGAFFYNTTDANGDAYQLYTLSGAPREAFEDFGHPRATPLFGPTFRGDPPIRLDDVLRDPRYGQWSPHRGMPPGHLPVRSYLAVPVLSRTAEVIGGLFFGHSETGVFTERAERIIIGVAAQAAIAIDNARLYERAQQAATEREQLLVSERTARADAERASAMKDEFLAMLSHELRTPLSAILGWAQVLRRQEQGNTGLQQALEVIERNARVQKQLIEDLLDVSRITSGKVRLELQPVEPIHCVEAAIEALRPTAEAKGVRMEKLLDAGAGPIAGDPSRLQQVVWNLISNAIKFTPKGGRVQVLLVRAESHVEISVADTGIGIEPEFLPHVFERFRQANSKITRAHGGLGLGLSIVKELVELHGGVVHAASNGRNGGATFRVHLPLLAVHGRPAPSVEPSAAAVADHTGERLAGVKVLVVDDEPDARTLIERVLRDCHASVYLAADAEEALAIVERERPDVMVSDIGMPHLDGYELLRRVRRLGAKRGGGLPAIALTAFARSQDRTRALRAGYLVHVSKPVEPSELTATVAAVVGRAGADGEEARAGG